MTAQLFAWLPAEHITAQAVAPDQGVLETTQLGISLRQEQLLVCFPGSKIWDSPLQYFWEWWKTHEYVDRDLSVSVVIAIQRFRFIGWWVVEQWQKVMKYIKDITYARVMEIRGAISYKKNKRNQNDSKAFFQATAFFLALPHYLAAQVSSGSKLSWLSPSMAWDVHASLRNYPDCSKSIWSSMKTAGQSYFFCQFLKAPLLSKVCLKSFCSTLPQFFWSGTRSPKIRCTLSSRPSVNTCWLGDWCGLFFLSTKIWLICVFASVLKPNSIPVSDLLKVGFFFVTCESNREIKKLHSII